MTNISDYGDRILLRYTWERKGYLPHFTVHFSLEELILGECHGFLSNMIRLRGKPVVESPTLAPYRPPEAVAA